MKIDKHIYFTNEEYARILDYKENFYKNLIKNHLEDVWNPMYQKKEEVESA